MSNIVIPYRGYLTQADNTSPDVPQSDLIIDLDPSKGVYDTATWNGSVYVGSNPITTDNTACALVTNQATYENPITNVIPTFHQTSSGRMPAWRSGDTEANGKPYLSFASSGDWMQFGIHSSSLNEFNEFSIYAVILPETSQSYSGGNVWSKSEDWYGYKGFASWIYRYGGRLTSVAGGDGDIDPNEIENLDPDDPELMTISQRIKATGTVEHSNRVQNEGASVDPRDTNVSDGFAAAWMSGSNELLIGTNRSRTTGEPPSASYSYRGRIYRFLIYDGIHTDTQELQVFSDLAAVYGI